MRTNGFFLSVCVEGIPWLFTNFYLQRNFSIFLRNYHDCKMILYWQIDLGVIYKKHILASKLFLFKKETLVEIFFDSVFGKSKCDNRCLHFWHNCCFLESSVSLISITMSLPEEQPSYDEPSSPVGRMQSGLAASFVTPSQKIKWWKWRPICWGRIFHQREEAIEHDGCKKCFEQWWAYVYSSDGKDDSFCRMGFQKVCFICLSLCHSVHLWGLREGYGVKEC